MKRISAFLFACIISCQVSAIPAFPGAEGFGSETPGGRGGAVVKVTNLYDSGPGSLREACALGYPRIIIFTIGGVIKLHSAIEITAPFITIAGETAPGGITLDGTGSEDGCLFTTYTNDLLQPVHDIVIRFIRARGTADSDNGDVLRLYNVNNAIVDHCSFGWGHDETADLSKSTNLTMQWCIFNESVATREHNLGIFHCYGNAANFTLHHCLLTHHKYRNPVLNSDNVDIRNNVIYDWRDNATHFDNINTAESAIPYPHHLSVVGNYYKQGPEWQPVPGEPIEIIDQYLFSIRDNLYEYKDGDRTSKQTDLTNIGTWGTFDPAFPPVTTSSPESAFYHVISSAGNLPHDVLDNKNISETVKGTGAWCKNIDVSLLINVNTDATRGNDTDNGGIPDDWATQNGIPSGNPSGDADSDGYTNIEEYLHYCAGVLTGMRYTGSIPVFMKPKFVKIASNSFVNQMPVNLDLPVESEEENGRCGPGALLALLPPVWFKYHGNGKSRKPVTGGNDRKCGK